MYTTQLRHRGDRFDYHTNTNFDQHPQRNSNTDCDVNRDVNNNLNRDGSRSDTTGSHRGRTTDTPLILIQAVDDVRITSSAPDMNLVVSDVLAIWNATDDEGVQHLINTLLKFSTDAIPAHDFNTLVSDPDRLESATLILTFEGVGMGFGETHFVELLDPDAEWSEQTVTWNTRPGVDPTQTALSFVLNFIVPFRIDVISLVHGALQATGPPVSIGFQLRRSPSEFSTFTNV